MVLFSNSGKENRSVANKSGSVSSRKLGLGALVLLHVASCTKDESANVLPSIQRVSPAAESKSESLEAHRDAQDVPSGQQSKVQMQVKASYVIFGRLSAFIVAGTELNVADRSADGVEPVTAKPLMYPQSKFPEEKMNFVTSLGENVPQTNIEAFKMSFLVDSPVVEAFARQSCPQKSMVQTKDGRYWENSDNMTPQSVPGRYFRFPIQSITGELLTPGGAVIADVKPISALDGQIIDFRLEPKTPEAEAWIRVHPTLDECRVSFRVEYPGVSEQTATLKVELSEKILGKVQEALKSKQAQAGGAVSLTSRDEACGIISQEIRRSIESDGPEALNRVTEMSINVLSGKIYEFFMTRGNQLRGDDLKRELMNKKTIDGLKKAIQQPVIDSTVVKQHEIQLYYWSHNNQWERLKEDTKINTATLQGGLAIGPFSVGGAGSSSNSSSEAIRRAWQESLRSQYGIDTEVENNSGYLKIVSLRSSSSLDRDYKMLIKEISDVRLRTGYGTAELPPTVIEIPNQDIYRDTMMKLFPLTEESRKLGELMSAFVFNGHADFAPGDSSGISASVLRGHQSLYDGVMKPEDLARVISSQKGATDLRITATLNPSNLSTNGDARGFWTSVLHFESSDQGDAVDIVVPHCGRLVTEGNKFLPEFVDPAAAMLAELKASGFGEIAKLLDQVSKTPDSSEVGYLQRFIASGIQALSSTERQRLCEILDQTKKHLSALYDVTTWLSVRLPAEDASKTEGTK